MRQERTVQCTLFDIFAAHEIGRELKAISQWLDEHRDVLGLVATDLRRHDLKDTGRHGLTAETVLRCALLKQHRQLSYEELAFGGFGIVPRFCSAAAGMVTEEISTATNHQCDQRGGMGDDQPRGDGQRAASQSGRWIGRADRQHGDGGVDACTDRQLAAVGRGSGDGAGPEES